MYDLRDLIIVMAGAVLQAIATRFLPTLAMTGLVKDGYSGKGWLQWFYYKIQVSHLVSSNTDITRSWKKMPTEFQFYLIRAAD